MSGNSSDFDKAPRQNGEKSFAETALELGGKSAEESRRTGVIDQADDQVEALFAPQYQTVNSPAHRAVWEKQPPYELFTSRTAIIPDGVKTVMEESIRVVGKHRKDGEKPSPCSLTTQCFPKPKFLEAKTLTSCFGGIPCQYYRISKLRTQFGLAEIVRISTKKHCPHSGPGRPLPSRTLGH